MAEANRWVFSILSSRYTTLYMVVTSNITLITPYQYVRYPHFQRSTYQRPLTLFRNHHQGGNLFGTLTASRPYLYTHTHTISRTQKRVYTKFNFSFSNQLGAAATALSRLPIIVFEEFQHLNYIRMTLTLVVRFNLLENTTSRMSWHFLDYLHSVFQIG